MKAVIQRDLKAWQSKLEVFESRCGGLLEEPEKVWHSIDFQVRARDLLLNIHSLEATIMARRMDWLHLLQIPSGQTYEVLLKNLPPETATEFGMLKSRQRTIEAKMVDFLELKAKPENGLVQIVEALDEGLFDALWNADKTLEQCYNDLQQGLDLGTLASMIDSAMKPVIDLKNQGEKSLNEWLVGRGATQPQMLLEWVTRYTELSIDLNPNSASPKAITNPKATVGDGACLSIPESN